MSQKIKLLAPQSHAGIDYKEGASLLVEESDATWLVENKVGELVLAQSSFITPVASASSAIDKT